MPNDNVPQVMNTHLLIFGDRVYFKGLRTPSNQLMVEAGGYWDETAGYYYLSVDQTDALLKLAGPYADMRMPVTGNVGPGTFFSFDAVEGFAVDFGSETNEAIFVTVYRKGSETIHP